LNETSQLLFCAYFVNLLDGKVNSIKKSTKILLVTSNEVGLEVEVEKEN